MTAKQAVEISNHGRLLTVQQEIERAARHGDRCAILREHYLTPEVVDYLNSNGFKHEIRKVQAWITYNELLITW